MKTIDISQSEEVFTVSRLNREVRFMLEGNFPLLWVEGEISNFSVPASGHWYFSLKDNGAQVRCAMFKPQNRRLNFVPKDGAHVLLKTRVSLYEGRGEFQLLAEHMEEVGEGQLRKAFEFLKQRLLAAGLFDAKHKQPIPTMPRAIGVITSPTGAAIRDILSVLRRRFPSIPVIIYPTLVQGDTAAKNIIGALQTAGQRRECDVLILARGGGSLEDLWPFNEEGVAHAIHACQIPIISGVGHEVDFTIADFVADARAPTPSAAAELCTPNQAELRQSLQLRQRRLMHWWRQKILQLQQHVDWMNKHLQQQHPRRRLQEQSQQLRLAARALRHLQQRRFGAVRAKLETLTAKLRSVTPHHKILRHRQSLRYQEQQSKTAILQWLQHYRERLGGIAAQLDTLSPLATLQRGYAVASKNQQLLASTRQVKVGDAITVRLKEGELDCAVTALTHSRGDE